MLPSAPEGAGAGPPGRRPCRVRAQRAPSGVGVTQEHARAYYWYRTSSAGADYNESK